MKAARGEGLARVHSFSCCWHEQNDSRGFWPRAACTILRDNPHNPTRCKKSEMCVQPLSGLGCIRFHRGDLLNLSRFRKINPSNWANILFLWKRGQLGWQQLLLPELPATWIQSSHPGALASPRAQANNYRFYNFFFTGALLSHSRTISINMCTQEVKKLSSGHQVLMGEEGAGEEGWVGGGPQWSVRKGWTWTETEKSESNLIRLTSSNNSTFLFSCWDKIAILQIPNLSFTSGMATALKVEQVIQSILVQDTESQVVLDALIGVWMSDRTHLM